MGKALILVGGFGTRLRPLTLTKPKPLVEFCNLAIVEHQIKALKEAGVTVVVLAVSYKPEDMLDAIKEMEKKYSIKLVISHETEPLGTGAHDCQQNSCESRPPPPRAHPRARACSWPSGARTGAPG